MDVNDPEDRRTTGGVEESAEAPAEDRGRFTVRRVVRPPREEPKRREVSVDETDLGWGDGPSARDDDWYKRERPPHHG